MVQHQMCKARTLFSNIFGESPRKGGGVRWGIELEHAEQTNRLGMDTLIEKYVKPCHKNKWSEQSAKKLLNFIKDHQDKAVAIVELAAVVDTGTPLIHSCYSCETKQPCVLVIADIISEMHNFYSQGPNQYTFVELTRQSTIAASIMTNAMVSCYYAL